MHHGFGWVHLEQAVKRTIAQTSDDQVRRRYSRPRSARREVQMFLKNLSGNVWESVRTGRALHVHVVKQYLSVRMRVGSYKACRPLNAGED